MLPPSICYHISAVTVRFVSHFALSKRNRWQVCKPCCLLCGYIATFVFNCGYFRPGYIFCSCFFYFFFLWWKDGGGTGWHVLMNADWSVYHANHFSAVVIGQNKNECRRSAGLSKVAIALFVPSKQEISCIDFVSLKRTLWQCIF